MTAPDRHVAPHELALFALSEEPNLPRFRKVRLHLQTGCKSCARTLAEGFRRHLDPRQPAVPSMTPPASWIRPEPVQAHRAVRVGVLSDTQFICGVGSYELDVLVRQLDAPLRLDIGGQITLTGAIHQPVAELPLTLIEADDAQVIENTTTDEFGEFAFPAEPKGRYGLRVGTDVMSPCVLLWESAQ